MNQMDLSKTCIVNIYIGHRFHRLICYMRMLSEDAIGHITARIEHIEATKNASSTCHPITRRPQPLMMIKRVNKYYVWRMSISGGANSMWIHRQVGRRQDGTDTE